MTSAEELRPSLEAAVDEVLERHGIVMADWVIGIDYPIPGDEEGGSSFRALAPQRCRWTLMCGIVVRLDNWVRSGDDVEADE